MKQVGIGTRVLNFIVDTLIIFFISWGAYRAHSFYVFYYHITDYAWYYFFWGILLIYYLLFELIFTRTPGKWLSMTKVVNLQGKRPAFWQILVRTVLRLTIPIDFFLIAFVDKTLHDYASKTAVVEV